MKKMAVVIAIVASLFVSCASLSYSTSTPDTFSSLSDINTWIYYNIDYDNVFDDVDTVAKAEVTLSTREGTCFDMSVLFVYLAKQSGWTVKLYPVETKTGYHMIVDAGSCGFYDPTNGKHLGYSLPEGWKATTF